MGARLFSLVLFCCDSFFSFRSPVENDGLRRFLAVASSLPLELQMVLCNRACGSTEDIVSKARLDWALRDLVWRLGLQGPH